MKKKILSVFMIICLFTPLLIACGESSTEPVKLTIIHTNDIRSHLDNAARRATVINQIRAENSQTNVLLLDAGNIFSGTPYFTLYQGQADLWFMNYLHYDAVCLGNHEFDKGPMVLANFINGANFPVLSANTDVSKEKSLSGKIVPWVIIEHGKQRYGVLGLTTEDTAEISSPGPTVAFENYLTAAKKALADLQTRGINKIIALTNLGWDNDIELAKKLEGIDIIVGGNSDTIPTPYPTVVNADSTPTLVVQAGENGDYVGCLNVTFDNDGVVHEAAGSRLIKIDDTITEDKVAAEKLATYQKPINDLKQTVIGETQVDLDGASDHVRSQETNLGDLVADAMLDNAAKAGATIALWNGGGIGTSIPAGDITLEQVIAVLPFDDQLVIADLTGEQLTAALENGVSQVEESAGRFPQIAGFRFTWDPGADVGSRIKNVEIKNGDGYQPLVNTDTYRIVTNDFIAKGGDGYTMFLQASRTFILGSVDYDVLSGYISAHSPVNPQTEGRIIQTKLGGS